MAEARIDAGESIEIAGPAATSLANCRILLYNGANGHVASRAFFHIIRARVAPVVTEWRAIIALIYVDVIEFEGSNTSRTFSSAA